MKIIWMAIIALILWSGDASAATKDCHDSRECFMDAFSKCDLAKVKTVQPTEEGGRVFVYAEIKGNTASGCQIYIYNDYSKDRFGGENTEDYCYQLQLVDRPMRKNLKNFLLEASKCEDQSRGDIRGI